MESDVTQSALFYKLWAWGDKNKKQLLWGFIALIAVGIIAAFWMAHESEKQNDANYALSKLMSRTGMPNAPQPGADDLLKVSADYPGTEAAQRALILAAADMFAEGKYDIARAQFQKFIQDYNSSPFAGQAALGVASCDDAQGKTNEAASGYEGVIGRYGSQNVAPQAKLGLARLQEAQGKFREARVTLEDLARSYPGTISSEAVARLQALNAAHPEAQAQAANPSPKIEQPVPSVAPAVTATNIKAP